MKIAFYCPNKPLSHPYPSGDLVIAQGILKSLASQGHTCREIVGFRSRWFWNRPTGWWRAIRAVFSAYKACRGFRPEFWLTYHSYYKAPDVMGPWCSRILHIPYAIFQPMYGTRRRKTARTKWGFVLNRRAIRSAHALFVNNLEDLEGVRRVADPFTVIYMPPGIFPEEFRRDEALGMEVRHRLGIPSKMPLVMTACRFRPGVKFQSLAYCFESLGILKDNYERFMLMVVGDGPAHREVQNLAEGRLGERCVFAGAVPREEMFHYYSAAHVFAFPGIGESLGMVYLEAQACGVPVVALRTAGVPQVVRNGETGFLVEDDGGRAMAMAVKRLLQDSALRNRMGAQGVEYVNRERNLNQNYRDLSRKLEAIRLRFLQNA